ncbi:MAG: calycin-like domain-containing protein [Paludibacteraceae bacterium]|nr:calycin-like domain-containing protein [Paludibacteraceae bacterium]
MKIKNFMAMMIAAASLSVGVVSCGDDDDEEAPAATDVKSLAETVSGTYNGVLSIQMMGMPFSDTVAYNIKKVDDSHINLTIPSISYTSMEIPSVEISNVEVKGTASAATASVAEVEGTVVVEGEEKTYTLSNILVNCADNKAVITYSIKYGKMPMPMSCSFEGTK